MGKDGRCGQGTQIRTIAVVTLGKARRPSTQERKARCRSNLSTRWPCPQARRQRRNPRGVFEKVSGSNEWWICFWDAQDRKRREKAGTKTNAIALFRKRKTQALEGKKLPEKLRCLHGAASQEGCSRRWNLRARTKKNSLESFPPLPSIGRKGSSTRHAFWHQSRGLWGSHV